jgi:hypothetical protein
MAIAYFPSGDDAEIIETTFVKANGVAVALRLLVDSGFTGESCVLLSDTSEEFVHAPFDSAHVSGALSGRQTRALVVCRIADLSFEATVIAILADTSGLNLPDGVNGMVGLSFLRLFHRWGAEQNLDGAWQFLLERTSE